MFKGRDELFCAVGSVVVFAWMEIATLNEPQKIGACIILVVLAATASILRAIRHLGDREE